MQSLVEQFGELVGLVIARDIEESTRRLMKLIYPLSPIVKVDPDKVVGPLASRTRNCTVLPVCPDGMPQAATIYAIARHKAER